MTASPIALLRSLSGSKEAPGALVRNAWDLLSPLPGGKLAFSRMVGRSAPYTGTIDARVEELRAGFARVVLPDRPAVRNHLRSVHAVAMLNLVEMTANLALSYTLPEDARFIVAGMSIEYLRKARGDVTASCECPVVASNERAEHELLVSLRDPAGTVVAEAKVRTLVGPRRVS
ncbi:MAG: DUF4442 domain-containing protein [Polyangiales bacterium]